MKQKEIMTKDFSIMIDNIRKNKIKRANYIPTEQDAMSIMVECIHRLKELGWNDAIYCPKDGSVFHAIEYGSSAIHECHYSGTWPNGLWWIHKEDDLWPSHPILFKRIKKEKNNEK